METCSGESGPEPSSRFRNEAIAQNQKRRFLALWRELNQFLERDAGFAGKLESCLRRERAFGARDRRLYRELIYTAVRFLPWVQSLDEDAFVTEVATLAEPLPATRLFKEVWAKKLPSPRCQSGTEGAANAMRDTTQLLPNWFRTECDAAFNAAEANCLATRPPLWIRLQCTSRAKIEDEWRSRGWPWLTTDATPDAWRMGHDIDITLSDAYRRGDVEIQDLGSQLILAHAGVETGENWLDVCAGAGGKTLQLAWLLRYGGSVSAEDIRDDALGALGERATRAGFRKIGDSGTRTGGQFCRGDAHELKLTVGGRMKGTFDAVLIDAPCSGTGTWRRAPHLKWCTTLSGIRMLADRQLRLLTAHASRVADGGRIVYATCSLCRTENESVVRRFIECSPEFSIEVPRRDFGYRFDGYGTTILPSLFDTDGFYVAIMRKKKAGR